MTHATALDFAAWLVPFYYATVNLSYAMLFYHSLWATVEHLRLLKSLRLDTTLATNLCPPVSIVVPARNEELGIVDSVESLLRLDYPAIEVVVVNDGSTDRTFQRLQERFDLAATDIPYVHRVATAPVRLTYLSRAEKRLLVLDKVSSGRKADALNAGLNAASSPFVCVIDGDALLERDALRRVMAPALNDADRVLASGGIVRAANGCTIANGAVVDVRLPRNPLAIFQVLEYLRSFLLGRQGWARLQMLLIVSGAFGVFRRDALLAIGGFRPSAIGEDMDLIVRLHRWGREQRLKYRIAFVPDPVCWTEVPETLGALGSQRSRWQNGLADVLRSNARMACNPAYGRIGVIAVPYQWLFELMSPVFEILGWAAVVCAACAGTLDAFFWSAALASILLGSFLSLGAVLMEEMVYRRYERWGDLSRLVVACFLEPFAYRPLTTLWRLRGLWTNVRRRNEWQLLPRTGFRTGRRPETGGVSSPP